MRGGIVRRGSNPPPSRMQPRVTLMTPLRRSGSQVASRPAFVKKWPSRRSRKKSAKSPIQMLHPRYIAIARRRTSRALPGMHRPRRGKTMRTLPITARPPNLCRGAALIRGSHRRNRRSGTTASDGRFRRRMMRGRLRRPISRHAEEIAPTHHRGEFHPRQVRRIPASSPRNPPPGNRCRISRHAGRIRGNCRCSHPRDRAAHSRSRLRRTRSVAGNFRSRPAILSRKAEHTPRRRRWERAGTQSPPPGRSRRVRTSAGHCRASARKLTRNGGVAQLPTHRK